MISPSEHRLIVARLSSAGKSNRGAGGYSRWVNRPVGRHFAAAAFALGLTPNQISLLSASCTYSAIAVVAALRPTALVALTVTVLLVVGYALDSADGQVARLRGGGSPAGEWLDHVLDAIKVASFHIAVAICWFRHFHIGHESALLIPLGYSVVASVFFFAITLADMLRRIAALASGGSGVTTASVNPREAAPVLPSLVVLPNDYGVLCLAMLLLAAHRWFEVVYTLLFAANVVFLIVGCGRWFTEMGRLRLATKNVSSPDAPAEHRQSPPTAAKRHS